MIKFIAFIGLARFGFGGSGGLRALVNTQFDDFGGLRRNGFAGLEGSR